MTAASHGLTNASIKTLQPNHLSFPNALLPQALAKQEQAKAEAFLLDKQKSEAKIKKIEAKVGAGYQTAPCKHAFGP